MKRIVFGMVIGVAAVALLNAGLGLANQHTSKKDSTEACTQMMQGTGVTEEGRKAMGEFMQSDRAPQAMANMMEMAGRMGDGDPMLGMTRMMEMMGDPGGMGGMSDRPDARQPGKRAAP